MTNTGMEETISAWPYPFPDLLDLFQKLRDEELKHADSEDEKSAIGDKYCEFLKRTIARGGPRS